MSLYEQYAKYTNDINYIDVDEDDGETPHQRLAVGLACVLYFKGGYTPAVRLKLLNCVQAYEQYYGQHIRIYTKPEHLSSKHGASKFKQGETMSQVFRSFMDKSDPDDALTTYFGNAKHLYEASSYSIYTMTVRSWEVEVRNPMDWLVFSVPIDEDTHSLKTFQQLVGYCCQQLNPVHGRAGIASLLPDQDDSYQPLEFDLVQRYFGIDIVSGSYFDTDYFQHNISRINWLTLLGSELEQRARHTPEWLAMTKTKGLQPKRYGQTLCIQAGEEPTLAPITEGIPALYKAVNDGLKPLRLIRDHGLHTNGGYQINMNERMAKLWLTRFDAEGIWPPYPAHNEFHEVDETISTDTPIMPYEDTYATPTTWNSIYTGDVAYSQQVCPKTGRWQAQNLGGKMVEVKAGDLMPEEGKQGVGEVIWYLLKE